MQGNLENPPRRSIEYTKRIDRKDNNKSSIGVLDTQLEYMSTELDRNGAELARLDHKP